MCSDGHWARLTHGSTAALVAPLGLARLDCAVTRALRRWQRWQRWQRWWGHTGNLGHDAGDAVAKVAPCASTQERQDDRYALASHSTVLALFARLPVCLLTTLFPPHTTTPSTTTPTTPATSAGPHSAASRDSGPTRPVRRPRLRHDVAPATTAVSAAAPLPLPHHAHGHCLDVRDDAHVASVAHGAAPARQVVQRSLVWVWWGCRGEDKTRFFAVSLLLDTLRTPLPLSPMLSTSSTIPSLPPYTAPCRGEARGACPSTAASCSTWPRVRLISRACSGPRGLRRSKGGAKGGAGSGAGRPRAQWVRRRERAKSTCKNLEST
jgi:hypothetical protein